MLRTLVLSSEKPLPLGMGYVTVSEADNAISLELAIDTAAYYGIDKDDAQKQAADMVSTISESWAPLAQRHGLSRSAIEYMRPAFLPQHTQG